MAVQRWNSLHREYLIRERITYFACSFSFKVSRAALVFLFFLFLSISVIEQSKVFLNLHIRARSVAGLN